MITNVLKSLKNEPKLWIFLYLVSAILAALIAIPFFGLTQKAIGNSLELNRLIEDFDYMAWSDFLRVNGDLYSKLVILILPLGIVYLLLSIFFNGGVLYSFNMEDEAFSFKNFFKASWKTFPKFLVVYILVALVFFCFLCASGILFFIATSFAESGNEKSLFFWLLIPIIIMIMLFSFTFVVGDYAKMLIYKNDHLGAGKAFSIAFAYVFKKPKTMLYFWILILISFVVLVIYLGLDTMIGVSGVVTIVLYFVLQQIVSFSKIVLRYAHLGVASRFFEQNPIELPERLVVREEGLGESDEVVSDSIQDNLD